MEEPVEQPIDITHEYERLLLELDQLLELNQHRLGMARQAIADKAIYKLSAFKLEELEIGKIIGKLQILDSIEGDRP